MNFNRSFFVSARTIRRTSRHPSKSHSVFTAIDAVLQHQAEIERCCKSVFHVPSSAQGTACIPRLYSTRRDTTKSWPSDGSHSVCRGGRPFSRPTLQAHETACQRLSDRKRSLMGTCSLQRATQMNYSLRQSTSGATKQCTPRYKEAKATFVSHLAVGGRTSHTLGGPERPVLNTVRKRPFKVP